MTLKPITRIVYSLLGVLYVVIGLGSMLLPAGWLPRRFSDIFLVGETPSPFFEHLLQEFGTVVLALGVVFLWRASRKQYSASFHWMMTAYFALDALIHWVGPDGVIGSWRRGVANTIPLVVMLLVGLLQRKATGQARQANGNDA